MTGQLCTVTAACAPGILIFALSAPGQAALSGDTDRIHGRAPTVAGDLVITHNGTVISNNASIRSSAIPADFTVSGDTSGLTAADMDGDCDNMATPCTFSVDTAASTFIWKHNGTPLTPAQMTSPLTAYTDETLTLEASAPATVTSPTGLPLTGNAPVSTTLTVGVTATLTYSANSFLFDETDGFPTTGYVGATYQIRIDGSDPSASDYTWTVDKSWVTVSSTGQVKFISEPAQGDGSYTISGTRQVTGETLQLVSSIRSWFTVTDPSMSWTDAKSACEGAGSIMPTAAEVAPGDRTQQIGTLFGEWRNLVDLYPKPPYYQFWTSTIVGNGTGPGGSDIIRTVDASGAYVAVVSSTYHSGLCVRPLQ